MWRGRRAWRRGAVSWVERVGIKQYRDRREFGASAGSRSEHTRVDGGVVEVGCGTVTCHRSLPDQAPKTASFLPK